MQALFLRGFPSFERINRTHRSDEFLPNLAKMFLDYQCAKQFEAFFSVSLKHLAISSIEDSQIFYWSILIRYKSTSVHHECRSLIGYATHYLFCCR